MSEQPNTPTNSGTRVVVISGMSGSGKSIALRSLEDMDYYCVDNLPVGLLSDLVDNLSRDGRCLFPRIAVGIDARNQPGDLSLLPSELSRLAELGIGYQLIFLDTREDVLIKRFSDTRRRHPLTAGGMPLADAIALERRLLKPLTAIADQVKDTSDLNVHQLRRMIATEVGSDEGPLSLLFESFAYRRGVPADADFVFDARCLPNPHWDPRLRPLNGKDQQIREYLGGDPVVQQYFSQICEFMETWIPRFESGTRSYITLAVGCTGGRHRSVYLAERLAEHFREAREQVMVFHRELE